MGVVAAITYVGGKFLESESNRAAERTRLSAADKAKESLSTGFDQYGNRMDDARKDLTTASDRYNPYVQTWLRRHQICI